jgi:transcriptional regulator with XRE-family HTH domain
MNEVKRKMRGNTLRLARVLIGKSQAQLSIDSGVHYSTISRLERGMIGPSEEQRGKLAQALHVPADSLFPPEQSSGK